MVQTPFFASSNTFGIIMGCNSRHCSSSKEISPLPLSEVGQRIQTIQLIRDDCEFKTRLL